MSGELWCWFVVFMRNVCKEVEPKKGEEAIWHVEKLIVPKVIFLKMPPL